MKPGVRSLTFHHMSYNAHDTLKPTYSYVGFFLFSNRYNGPMNIVTAMEKLAVEHHASNHDGVIETILSKLFIRGDVVHKAYKHRTADFADLANADVRRYFIAEDFFWNNAMAPEIYLELRGVKKDGDRFIHTTDAASEDWYIVMKKIDTEKNLIRTLEERAPTKEELVEYVRTLQERVRSLTAARRGDLEQFFTKNIAHVTSEVLATKEWAYTADDLLSRKEIDNIATLMEHAMTIDPYWSDSLHTLSVVIDTNGENILFLDDGISFIDVMPPKDAWRVHDEYFIICRTSTDISALRDQKHADILHETFVTHGTPPSPLVRMVYEIAAGLIQVPYRKMLGQSDLALKYADFVRARAKELEEEIEKIDSKAR